MLFRWGEKISFLDHTRSHFSRSIFWIILLIISAWTTRSSFSWSIFWIILLSISAWTNRSSFSWSVSRLATISSWTNRTSFSWSVSRSGLLTISRWTNRSSPGITKLPKLPRILKSLISESQNLKISKNFGISA